MLPDVARCQESEGEQNQEEIRGLKLGHSNSFFRWFFFASANDAGPEYFFSK